MFGENSPNCETFIFDFTRDLYGETLSVGLVAYLRSEETLDGLDALIAQMDADCSRARRILGQLLASAQTESRCAKNFGRRCRFPR